MFDLVSLLLATILRDDHYDNRCALAHTVSGTIGTHTWCISVGYLLVHGDTFVLIDGSNGEEEQN